LDALPFCHLQIKVLRCPYPRLWKCKQKSFEKPASFGERIRKRRLELHLLQSQLAEHLGVNRNSVQNWERGIHEPSPDAMVNVIRFLGYDPRIISP